MIPLLLASGGVVCLTTTLVLLRALGPRYRIARLLSATPQADITEARELAHGRPVYIRVSGRISSDEEFPDEHDRPLVYRRKRIEISQGGGGWKALADGREAVPFGIQTRDAFIGVDIGAIGDGLIAIPREAVGQLSDLPVDVGPLPGESAFGMAPETPARLLIEQLSAVEHATICGTPVLRDGEPLLTSGGERPLIVTSLEVSAAMRLLAAGHRRRVVLAGMLAALGVGLVLVAAGALVAGL